MTSSYSGSSQPSVNSSGELVWKPAVGLHFKPADDKAESYGGVLGAIQDAIKQSNRRALVKEYPESFAGIITAIQDLGVGEDKPGSDADTKPPGTEIIVGPDGNPETIVIVPPQDGDLWFDTRQGRLFVAVDNEWYQANGADGIAIVSATQPTGNVVIGQFWWDPVNDNLYIFDGVWVEPATGNFSEYSDTLVDPQPTWKPIGGGQGTLQTTATLPLSIASAESLKTAAAASNLPDIDENDFSNQKDYNEWLMTALESLDNAIGNFESSVFVGVNPPAYPEKGSLWYDTQNLELSVYYEQPNGVCVWAPTSASYELNENIVAINAAINEEAQTREHRLNQLRIIIDAANATQNLNINNVKAQLNNLQSAVADINVPSVYGLASESYVNNATLALQEALDAIEIPSLTGYATQSYVDQELAPLIQAESTHATKAELEEVRSQIPSLANCATSASLAQELVNINNTYFPREGGSVLGQIAWSTPYDGRNGIKFATYSPDLDVDATFGTTDNWYEFAWDFTSKEDFCWVHNDNKVFSITKDGPACQELYLGTFSPNDLNGRVLSNTIGVKSKLEQHQLGFQRILAAALSATTFDEFKGKLINTLSGF